VYWWFVFVWITYQIPSHPHVPIEKLFSKTHALVFVLGVLRGF